MIQVYYAILCYEQWIYERWRPAMFMLSSWDDFGLLPWLTNVMHIYIYIYIEYINLTSSKKNTLLQGIFICAHDMGQIIIKPLAETSRGRKSHVYPIAPPHTPKFNANIKDLAYRVLQWLNLMSIYFNFDVVSDYDIFVHRL